MLATGLYPQHFHMPSRPSPLSERSANSASHTFQFTMSTPAQSEKKSYTAPQRAYKPNPVVQTRDAATKRRRDMFFNRVQKERDDKKWEVRGEQIQRLDHMNEQRRWEAEKARRAPQLDDEMIEEELNELMESEPQEMDEADYVLAQEEQEMQELIAAMEAEQADESQNYGSDDEDYDQLFKEYAWNMQQPSSQQQQVHQDTRISGTDMDAMDMS